MKLVFGTIAAVALATTALAHSGATGIVKERMDMMKDLGATLKSLSVMARSGAHDPAFITTSAQEMQAHATHLADMFPEGSDDSPSEAAPAIWTDGAGFDALFDDLKAAAVALEKSADDREVFPELIARIGQTCRDCHDDFRVKKH